MMFAAEGTRECYKTLGPSLNHLVEQEMLQQAISGQIGAGSSIPHATTGNNFFKKGDTLVTGARIKR